MNYLLDVNVLVAWGWTDHVAHDAEFATLDTAIPGAFLVPGVDAAN